LNTCEISGESLKHLQWLELLHTRLAEKYISTVSALSIDRAFLLLANACYCKRFSLVEEAESLRGKFRNFLRSSNHYAVDKLLSIEAMNSSNFIKII
jgi:hypothetical protein